MHSLVAALDKSGNLYFEPRAGDLAGLQAWFKLPPADHYGFHLGPRPGGHWDDPSSFMFTVPPSLPAWHDSSKLEQAIKDLRSAVGAMVVSGDATKEIDKGSVILGRGARVDRVKGTAFVVAVESGARISMLSDTATVCWMAPLSEIGAVAGRGVVRHTSVKAKIERAEGASRIATLWGHVMHVRGAAVVELLTEGGRIDVLSDRARVEQAAGSSSIISMYGDAVVNHLAGAARIQDVSESAVVRQVGDNAVIQKLSGSAIVDRVDADARIILADEKASIQLVHGKACVDQLAGEARVEHVLGNGNVGMIKAAARVNFAGADAQIKTMIDDAHLERLGGKARVWALGGAATIGRMEGESRLQEIHTSATISEVAGKALVLRATDKSMIHMLSEEGCVELLSGKARIEAMTDNSAVTKIVGEAGVDIAGGHALIDMMAGPGVIKELGENSRLNTLNSGRIELVTGTARVVGAFGGTIKMAAQNASAGNVAGKAMIEHACGDFVTDVLGGLAEIRALLENSRVGTAHQRSVIGLAGGEANVGTLSGTARVQRAEGRAVIGEVSAGAQVEILAEEADVFEFEGPNPVVNDIRGKAMAPAPAVPSRRGGRVRP